MTATTASAGDKFLKGRTQFLLDHALESWYSAIYPHTPRTVTLPLTPEDAAALLYSCERKWSKYRESDEQLEKRFVQLIGSLQAVLDKQFPGSVPCFVKLSTRSPKDAVNEVLNERMERALLREMEQGSDGSQNGDCVAFVNATRRCLSVRSAEEAVALLCGSSRVREDLGKVMEFKDFGDKVGLQLREWTEMSAVDEFRGFVWDKELNALSQYCYHQYFPQLGGSSKEAQARRTRIAERVRAFWGEIRARVPQRNCVVDFAVLGEDRVVVIEINPFFAETGACLFSWKSKSDVQTMKNGPFEMRVLERPEPHPLLSLPVPWRDFICRTRGIDPMQLVRAARASDSKASSSASAAFEPALRRPTRGRHVCGAPLRLWVLMALLVLLVAVIWRVLR